MSYRNRTGLCGLLIGCSLVVASACGGLDSVKVIVTPEDGGSGNPSGGKSGGGGKPSGGDTSSEAGAAGSEDAAGAGGAAAGAGSAGAAGDDASGGEGGQVIIIPDPLPGPPTVVTVSPTDGLTTADPLGLVRVSFSEPLDPASVTSNSIQLKDESGALVGGTVTYADAVVTFKSVVRLNLLGKYTVNVSTAVTDADKTAMERPFTSSFRVRDGEWGKIEASLTENTSAFDPQSVVALATDGGGHATAVWAQAANANATTSDVYAALFTEGKGWATPIKINSNLADCQYPSVAMNASGNTIVGWVESDVVLGLSVQARRNIGGLWDRASIKVDAPTTPALSTFPSGVAVALTTKGEAHVSWLHSNQDAATGVISFGQNTRHADAAGNWDASVTKFPYQASPGTSPPSLAFDEAGNGFNAYQFSTGVNKTNTVIFRYAADTGKWGTSAITGGASEGRAEPVALAMSSAGEAILSWARTSVVDANNSNYELMGSRFNKAWSPPEVISNAKTAIASSKAMASAIWTGTSFWVAWAQSSGSLYNVYVNEHKASWSGPAIISDGKHSALLPWLSTDSRGNALAVWYQKSDSSSTSLVDPFDIAFSRLVGESGKWSDSGLVSRAVAGYRFSQVITLADGTSIAAWQRNFSKIVNGAFKNEFR
jgi:hypothetical protein